MADPVDQSAPWGWIPDAWRNAGGAIADSLGNAAPNAAFASLGLAPIAPPPPDAPPLAAYPSLQGPAPMPPPVDDSLAGAPGAPAGVAPAVAMPTVPPGPAVAPPIPPPFDAALAGAPGAAGSPELAQMPTLPPPPEPAYPPMAMPTVPGAGFDPTSPAAWDTAQNSEIRRLATEDPIAFAAEQAKHEQAAKDSVAADTLNAARENHMRAAQDWTDYQKATAASQAQMQQVVTDAQELAKRQVDPDPRSTFSKIRGVLAAFVGGLVAPYNGGRNVGLEAIQKEIEQGVAAQQAEIQNQWKSIDVRKGAAADGLTRANDLYRTGETARLSLWQASINDLQAKQAQYDPRGTAAMNIASAIQGARAKMADIQLRLQETLTKQNIDVIKTIREQQALELEKQKAAEAARHAREEEVVAKQNASTSSYSAQTGRMSALNTAANQKDELAFKIAELKSKGDDKGAEKLQKFGIVGVTPESPTDEPVAMAHNATDAEMGPLRDDVAATRSIVNDIDKIVSIRHGGSTKTGNSAEYQQLKATAADLLLKLKESNKLKNITDTDLDILTDLRGFDDPTKFRSFRDGILQFRQNELDNVNEKLHAHGVKGSVDLPPLPPAQMSDTEQAVAFAGQNPAPIPFAAVAGAGGASRLTSQQQVATVQNLRAAYDSATPDDRKKLRAQLGALANDATNSAVRDEAMKAVQQIDLGEALPAETSATSSRGTE